MCLAWSNSHKLSLRTKLTFIPNSILMDNCVVSLKVRDVKTSENDLCVQAVQEFGVMCQERESDVVKGVLPYWPRIYCKISVVSFKSQTRTSACFSFSYSCILTISKQLHLLWSNLHLLYVTTYNYYILTVLGSWPSSSRGHTAGIRAVDSEGQTKPCSLPKRYNGPLAHSSVWHLFPCCLCC